MEWIVKQLMKLPTWFWGITSCGMMAWMFVGVIVELMK